jgi:hypothetical protein
MSDCECCLLQSDAETDSFEMAENLKPIGPIKFYIFTMMKGLDFDLMGCGVVQSASLP